MPKTIFGTTEKSNFILNMKTETYHKWNLWILLSFLILMPVMSVPLEFARVYSLPVIALALTGVMAIVFSFIGYMKSATPRSLLLPTVLVCALAAWNIVSMYDAFVLNVATFGADGRGEGALSALFYGAFFLLGAQLGTDDNRRRLLRGMLWMGLAECAWALLQMLPIGFPSYYQNLEPMLLFRVFLPSGLTGSPIFLAILLVMLAFPAVLGAMGSTERRERVLCLVSTGVFLFTAARTQCLIGIAGGILVLLGALVWGLAQKQGKRMALPVGIAAGAFVLGLVLAAAAPAINATYSRYGGTDTSVSAGMTLYDGGIMWKDGSYRLAASGYYSDYDSNPNGYAKVDDIAGSYLYRDRVTAGIVKKYPLLGTGPDNLVYAQLYQSLKIGSNLNVFDRAYNQYLQVAATTGIPALLLYLAVMGIAAVRGIRGAGKGWLEAGIAGAVVLYLLAMLTGASSITVAPLFWALAGCCAGMERK